KSPGAGDKTVLGTMSAGPNLLLVKLDATTARALDENETVKKTDPEKDLGPGPFEAVIRKLRQAEAKKATVAEVRGWVDKAVKDAAAFGPAWQRNIATFAAEALNNQEGYGAAAADAARVGAGLLGPKERTGLQRRVLTALLKALKDSGKG